jgi:hypothetical protein
MELKLLKYLSVLGGAMLKFIFGPTIGLASGLSYWETVFFTVLGMMTAVCAVSFLGLPFRLFLLQRFAKNAKKFSPRKRMIVKIWKKYGLVGIACLTPLILTPIGGSIIAVSFGEKIQKIIFYMLISATIWAIILSAVLFFAKNLLQ